MLTALTFAATHSTLLFVMGLIFFIECRWFFVPGDRKRIEHLLILCVVVIPSVLEIVRRAQGALTRMSMPDYDLYVFHIDGVFGYPSFKIAQLVDAHSWSYLLILCDYNFFTGASILTIAAYIWLGPKEELIAVLEAFALNFLLIVAIYIVLPVCGPRYAFAQFPHLPPRIVPLRTVLLHATPNGVPSGHASNSFLVFWFSRRWRTGRIAGALFAILTVIAVLATGEHYFFDVLCAVPYSALVIYVTSYASGTQDFDKDPTNGQGRERLQNTLESA